MRPCIPVHVHILLRVFWKHAIFFLLYIQTCGFLQMLALVVNAFFRTINTPIPKPNPSKYLISQIEHEILHTYLVTHLSFRRDGCFLFQVCVGRTGADAFTRRQTQGVKEARVEPMRLQRFLKKRLHPGGGTGFFLKTGFWSLVFVQLIYFYT